MHTVFSPITFGIICILFFGLIEVALIKYLNRRWWALRWVRIVAWSLPVAGILMIFVWGLSEYQSNNTLGYFSSVALLLILIAEVALMLSLPVSGVFHLMHTLADRIRHRKASESQPPDSERRLFLQTAAAAVPLMTIATGVTGVARSFTEVKVETKVIFFDNLPPGLDGFRIWHVSDTHIRHFVTLSDLELVIEQAKSHSPHITLLTGDISDDVTLLGPALSAIDSVRPPYGTYACLGNHEYYRGIKKVREIYDRGPVPLMIDRGIPLSINGASMYLAAIDDPRSISATDPDFFNRTIDNAMQNSRGSDFTLLMSHRPDALDYASQRNISLVLSGHTHGGQVGFMGKSAFSYMWPDAYLWGLYRKQATQMYLTCGAGHWFPFRLGCPPEALIIELSSSSHTTVNG